MRPEFEHVFAEDATLVLRADQIIQFLNVLAVGELTGGDEREEECLTLRGVLTVGAREVLRLILESTQMFVERHGTAVAEPVVTEDYEDAFPLLPVMSGEPAERRGYTPLRGQRVVLPEPGEGGAVNFVEWLPEPLFSLYDDDRRTAEAFREPSQAQLDAFPILRPCSEREYVELIGRMVESGMVELQHDPARCVNGLFAVRKSDEEDRLIIDCRRGNLFLQPSPEVRLPSPADLADMVFVKPRGSQVGNLVVAKSDISAYYHRLQMPVWMRQIYGLPPFRDRGGVMVYPVCVSLPMGCSHGPFIAHSFHQVCVEEVLETEDEDDGVPVVQVGVFEEEVVDSRDHLAAVGTYIDDQFYLALPMHLDETNALMRKVNEVLVQRGLVVSDSKLVWARQGHGETDVLGMAVCEDGLIVPKGSRLAAIIGDTLKMVAAGRASSRALGSLVGRWVWNILLRRCVLSVLQDVYALVERDEPVVEALPRMARVELVGLVTLSPLLMANVFAPVSTMMVATDASLQGAGVCVCRVSEAEAWAVYARRIRRGWWAAALLDPWGEVDDAEAEGDDVSEGRRPRMSRVTKEVIVRAQWETVISCGFWFQEDRIVLLEAHAVLMALRWLAVNPENFGKRIIFLVDSMALLGALAKGRSSTRRLNRLCRRVAALLLATRIRPVWVWVESALNPADAPSRAVGQRQ